MAKHSITNSGVGPRGFWQGENLVLVEPDQTIEDVELSADELKQAKATGYFTFDGGKADKRLPGLTGKSKDQLIAIARDEEVVLPDTATAEQITDAIKQKREAGAEAE
jgi:hypothetical protein